MVQPNPVHRPGHPVVKKQPLLNKQSFLNYLTSIFFYQ